MSIDYDAYVEAVGPAEQIAEFKRRALANPCGPTSYGVELESDSPNHVAFREATHGSARNLAHQPPELFYFGLENSDAIGISELTIRALLTTECVNFEEYVVRNGERLFAEGSSYDLSVEVGPNESFPLIVHGNEGNLNAWAEACARHGVELNY